MVQRKPPNPRRAIQRFIADTIAHMKGSIDELGFSKRVSNRLKYEGIKTIRALVNRTPYELLSWPHFGLSSIKEVRTVLEDRGLSLKDDPGSHAIWEWVHAGKPPRPK